MTDEAKDLLTRIATETSLRPVLLFLFASSHARFFARTLAHARTHARSHAHARKRRTKRRKKRKHAFITTLCAGPATTCTKVPVGMLTANQQSAATPRKWGGESWRGPKAPPCLFRSAPGFAGGGGSAQGRGPAAMGFKFGAGACSGPGFCDGAEGLKTTQHET